VVNVNPRRKTKAGPKRQGKAAPEPWRHGDPTRKIGLNTPIPEPLMMQLDYLVENRVIFSKASFIRDVVAKAAEAEIIRFRRVQEAVRKIDQR
jgi:hypothetical protein